MAENNLATTARSSPPELNAPPKTEETPLIRDEAEGVQPKTAESQNLGAPPEIADDEQDEAAGATEGARQQAVARGRGVNQNGLVRGILAIKNRKEIKKLNRQKKENEKTLRKKNRRLFSLKSKLLFQELRIAGEALTGIGLIPAAIEVVRAFRKNKNIKQLRKEIKNLKADQTALDSKIAKLLSLWQSASYTNNPATPNQNREAA